MKRTIYILLISILLVSCEKTVVINDPYAAGVCVGEIELGSVEGSLSILVETKGEWRLESDQPWLTLDTKGRSGNGTFTVRYDSNESNASDMRSERTAKVTFHLSEVLKADTLVFVQKGLSDVKLSRKVENDPELKLEYKTEELSELVILCCSSEGDADVNVWIEKQGADVVVLDGVVSGASVDGLQIVGRSYAAESAADEYSDFKALIEQTYNSRPDAGNDWIFAGLMSHHLSSMQTGYAGVPEWYPESAEDQLFRSDIYAWQNNLYDCVWMYNQTYLDRFQDEAGNYCANYIYASPSVFAKAVSAELLEAEGMKHKAIRLTLKY